MYKKRSHRTPIYLISTVLAVMKRLFEKSLKKFEFCQWQWGWRFWYMTSKLQDVLVFKYFATYIYGTLKINNLKKLKDRNSITHTSLSFKTCSTAAVILLSSRGVVFTSSMTCVMSLSILLSGNLSNYRAIFLRHSVLNAAHTCSIGFSGLE